MTERQNLIAHKIAVQSAKNTLKQISGICVLEIYEENENHDLNELYSAYTVTYGYNEKPYSKLPYNSSEEKISSWLIDTMGLKEQREYFLFCGLWSRVKILDIKQAVSALWRHNKNCTGFLLAEIDLSRILECGSDSRDEDHYLIDIWEKEKLSIYWDNKQPYNSGLPSKLSTREI